MLKLSVYNRFSKSPVYFDICKESFNEFEDSKNTLITEFKKYGSELSADRLNFLSRKMDRDFAISITFAAMCLEAFIYDYAATYFTDTYAKNYLQDIDFVSKWVVVPKLVTGKDFPTDSQAFEQLQKLRKERNDLVHYKSKPFPDREQLVKMIQETKEETKGRKEFNPYQTIIEALIELRNLDDEVEDKWWELVEIN